jgi:hypothetical protein
MATSANQRITFVVPGTPVASATRGAAAAGPPQAPAIKGEVKQSVRVAAQRGEGSEVRVEAIPGEDVVVLHLANGPTLVLHPENARDLMLAQSERRAGSEPGATVQVPVQLRWRGLEQGVAARGPSRGLLGDVFLTGIDIIAGGAKGKLADFAASQVVALFDGQVDGGVYHLDSQQLPKLKGRKPAVIADAVASDGPMLVFVHGTFCDTCGTFARLWTDHPQLVRLLFERYRGHVFALDHPTLGATPIANALTLAKAMPPGARLHLATHSRGGLVAETLARVAANPDAILGPSAGIPREHAAELKALAQEVKKKSLTVERVVRVACPARGTLLASKRLDAYLSVVKWSLELASIPIAPALVDLLAEIAQKRADPEALPGLAAQIPDSPLIQWLHSVDDEIPGDLRVVAGDVQGDSVMAWVKTLLADSFFWTDNDLVVQTRSMYGGAPRATATFLLDQGGKVTHFTYFSNERTASAVVRALVEDRPADFRRIGPLSRAGEDSSGVRARRAPRLASKPVTDKPALFLIPGILGSHLKVQGSRVWLGWRLVNGLGRLKWESGATDGVLPDGAIESIYGELAEFFDRTHEVIEFSFDWRRPIEDEARRLAEAMDAALTARATSGQPVRILAHSMGGLVARTAQIVEPEIWKRVMGRAGSRVLMLGTPNAGSWAPMQVLSGDDSFGNTIVNLGAPFKDHEARMLMAAMPGFIQLQAGLLDEARGLGRRDIWQKLADDDLAIAQSLSWWHAVTLQRRACTWGVPTTEALDRAVALRTRLDDQRAKALEAFQDRMLLVVGRADFTPDGFEWGDRGLVYLDATDDGDGRVTLESALLPGVRTWKLDCDHGTLPSESGAFTAYLELLDSGTTTLLAPLAQSAVRGAIATRSADGAAVVTRSGDGAARVRSRPSRTRSGERPRQSDADLYALDDRQLTGPAARGTALRISVTNGDLSFVAQPILLGHYRSMRLTGTERVMDRLIGGTMDRSLRAGLYPDPPGTHQIFVNTRADSGNPLRRLPRPAAVIVAGLGEEGALRPSSVVQTVRQAILAWSQHVIEQDARAPAVFELAATLLGSGGAGITVGQSAQLIAQGVREANERLEETAWPTVSHVHIVELYLDRATDALRALQLQASATPGRFVIDEIVHAGQGALRRPLDSGYRGTDHDFISATTAEGPGGERAISYALDTRRARSEVRAQKLQGSLIKELVFNASNASDGDGEIGRTLFTLLVPPEMEPYLAGTTAMMMEVDRGTAGIPWELLDTRTHGDRETVPWAIRARLLRKLRSEHYRGHVVDATGDAAVLVVGEPECDPQQYLRLPGARNEALAVANRLCAPGALEADRVRRLISEDPEAYGPNARTVIGALLERDWRVVHIAGHGEPPEMITDAAGATTVGSARGVVLSNDIFLGPREIESMRVVPELVFVNCCHLASRHIDELLRPYDRPAFAAGVAEALINIGVRCVVAAGWAVDDAAASAFATTFYDSLLRGAPFIDAVAAAREAARAFGGNTWAAYQCYGDPSWTLRRETGDAQRPASGLLDELSGLASAQALKLALESLAVRSQFQQARGHNAAQDEAIENQRARLRYLEERFDGLYGAYGDVAEAFALAWAETGHAEKAVAWYQRACDAPDGKASLKAVEQLVNQRVRLAWHGVEKARASLGARASRKATEDTFRSGRAEILAAIETLDTLVSLRCTLERENLYASAYKRLSLIEHAAGRRAAEHRMLRKMNEHCQRAEKLAHETGAGNYYYPAMNHLASEVVLTAGRKTGTLDSKLVERVRQSLDAAVEADPDFWSVVGQTELRVLEAIDAGDLESAIESIERELADLQARVPGVWYWASVFDRASLILPTYARHTKDRKEKQAAAQLLEQLRGFAGRGLDERAVDGGGPPAVSGSSTRDTRRSARRRGRR